VQRTVGFLIIKPRQGVERDVQVSLGGRGVMKILFRWVNRDYLPAGAISVSVVPAVGESVREFAAPGS
jgi:hypothetical protein